MSHTMQFTDSGPAPADTRYDPRYDPLVAPTPGAGRDYAPTWWVASAGVPPPDDGPVTHVHTGGKQGCGSGGDCGKAGQRPAAGGVLRRGGAV